MSDAPCECAAAVHGCRFVVVTGGPGAGKTALLEVVRRNFCRHVVVLPEAAGIVFGGGFPRDADPPSLRAAQRAIYHVQVELERRVREQAEAAVVLCDRGTLDGLGYWPDNRDSWFADLGTSWQTELSRYAAVVHLSVPPADGGYDYSNPLRIESAGQAARLDDRIAAAWSEHPRRTVVPSAGAFIDKVARAIALIRDEVPPCCRSHLIAEIGDHP